MLEIRDLRRRGLDAVTLTVRPGQCVAVTGPSGSGKTLFLRAVADLDRAEGSVKLDNVDRDVMQAPAWRRQVSYVPAESAWWADQVGAHFAVPDDALPFLEAMDLDRDAFDWPVARLSTGERQRLGLARALALSPRCLLLDEPTSGLDDANQNRVEAIISAHLAQGRTALIVTHDTVQARRLAASALRFEQGRNEWGSL